MPAAKPDHQIDTAGRLLDRFALLGLDLFGTFFGRRGFFGLGLLFGHVGKGTREVRPGSVYIT